MLTKKKPSKNCQNPSNNVLHWRCINPVHAAHPQAETDSLVFPSNSLVPGSGRPASHSPPAPCRCLPLSLTANRKYFVWCPQRLANVIISCCHWPLLFASLRFPVHTYPFFSDFMWKLFLCSSFWYAIHYSMSIRSLTVLSYWMSIKNHFFNILIKLYRSIVTKPRLKNHS